jgi:hypothetical protein
MEELGAYCRTLWGKFVEVCGWEGRRGLDEEYDHWAENLDEIIMAVEA